MANCTKFLEARERHAKESHPKCRRRGTSPRLSKTVGPKTQYAILRQVVTLIPPQVVIQGKRKKMVFFTNNLDWTPRTIAELYKARWAVELFFKEFKQTCQVRDFIGYNERAVKWQVWIGLVVHLLLRFVKLGSKWELSFSRLAGGASAVPCGCAASCSRSSRSWGGNVGRQVPGRRRPRRQDP